MVVSAGSRTLAYMLLINVPANQTMHTYEGGWYKFL